MKTLKKMFRVDLTLFNNTNVTGDSGMTVEMKTYYNMDLLRIARAKLVHNKYAQKANIPQGKGKTIEFRKYSPLPKALTPLTEGVTPNGRKMTATNLTATVGQYGDYIELSDVLEMTTIDNQLVQANKLLAPQAGETIDTLCREVISAGTNVQYADSRVAARYLLVGGNGTWANNHYFSVECIRQAALNLRNNKANGIEGLYFVAICHADTVYTLKKDQEWIDANKYVDNKPLLEGEVGMYDGVRIVMTTEAKIFHAADLSAANRNLTMASVATKTFTISQTLTAGDQSALVGRKIIIKGYLYTVASATASTIVVNETVQGTPTTDTIYPGEAGDSGRDVYSTLVIGSDAYGATEIEGGGLEMIVKQLGSAGAADPLNQRATSGWKTTYVAEILQDVFMVRVEHTTPYQRGAN